MDLDRKIDELHTFIKNWKEELRVDLNLPASGATLGISFVPEMALTRMPGEAQVPPGLYESNDGVLRVEVVDQNSQQQVMFLIVTNGSLSQSLDVMSVKVFNKLFKPFAPPGMPSYPSLDSLDGA